MFITKTVYSKGITKSKLHRLSSLAKDLCKFRSFTWQKYGSLKSININHRKIRDNLVATKNTPNLPGRLWKETLNDTCSNIKAAYAAAKREVIFNIYKQEKDKTKRKEIVSIINKGEWLNHPKLHRDMRKAFKHGKNHTFNQINLDPISYTTFTKSGKTWLSIMCQDKGKRMCIPLNTNAHISGTLRLIILNGEVQVNYYAEVEIKDNCGKATLGLDKGYTEVFVDSEGQIHGDGLGDILTQRTEEISLKNKRRAKIRSVLNKANKKNPKKAARIKANNLGRKKYNCKDKKHKAKVLDLVCKSIHAVLDKAKDIVTENLKFKGKNKNFGKKINRRLAAWVKGLIAKKLEDISQRRSASLHVVNASYTSQTCHKCGSFGTRTSDLFYCHGCGDVFHADYNAAINILNRLYDPDIGVYDSPVKVKKILEERYSQRLRLPNPDSSCLVGAVTLTVSTESELLKLC